MARTVSTRTRNLPAPIASCVPLSVAARAPACPVAQAASNKAALSAARQPCRRRSVLALG